MSVDAEKNLILNPGIWLCIDPGNKQSGWITCVEDESVTGHLRIIGSGIWPNRLLRRELAQQKDKHSGALLLIECPKPRGQPTASEEMETLVEIGRILQMWRGPWSYIFRQQAKIGITGMAAGKDKHVSQALKDRFGGEDVAVGGRKCKTCHGTKVIGKAVCPKCRSSTKKDNDCKHCHGGTDKTVYRKRACSDCGRTGWIGGHPPGPLFDMKEHKWAALLLACYWQDSEQDLVKDIAGKQPAKKKRNAKKRTSVAVPAEQSQ